MRCLKNSQLWTSSRTVVKYGFETQVNSGKGCASSDGARMESWGALIIKGMQNTMHVIRNKDCMAVTALTLITTL